MPARRKVIFVCVENSNRSQIAEAFARIHGGDTVEAFSAGSRPSGRVNPKAISAMAEVGYDLTTHQSKGLDEFNGKEFDAAVTMGCGDECPLVIAKKRVDWQIPDPKELPPDQFNQVRDLIEAKVKELLTSLAKEAAAKLNVDVLIKAPEGDVFVVFHDRDSSGGVEKTHTPPAPPPSGPKTMSLFERYLTVWVGLCMIVGVLLGRALPTLTDALRGLEFGAGSQINAPIAFLIWLMIVPMMMKIDFSSLAGVTRRPQGLAVTLFVNWVVKPFSMFALGWLFFQVLFLPLIGEELAKQYTAGVIILAAAPCTAMVFVWSYLTDGDPAYTLVQVAVNDLIMLVLFAPIIGLLVGVSGLAVPFNVLLTAVAVFIVVPLTAGVILRTMLVRSKGKEWFEKSFLPRFQLVAVTALLATLVLIFAFQADNILDHPLHVVLIAVPILLQVYFNSALAYGLMWLYRVPHSVAAPGALIGASNFFELAVATAIALYGPGSGAALATVVGVLVEVPVMLSVCAACNRTRGWFTRLEGENTFSSIEELNAVRQ